MRTIRPIGHVKLGIHDLRGMLVLQQFLHLPCYIAGILGYMSTKLAAATIEQEGSMLRPTLF